jgi:hypothetical protein
MTLLQKKLATKSVAKFFEEYFGERYQRIFVLSLPLSLNVLSRIVHNTFGHEPDNMTNSSSDGIWFIA